MFDRLMQRTDGRVDHTEMTTLTLSNDIGKMSDRIGVMADRIGEMAERIVKTQEMQSQNMELMQKSMLETMQTMVKQMELSNKIIEIMINSGVNVAEKLPNGKMLTPESLSTFASTSTSLFAHPARKSTAQACVGE